MYKRCQDEPLLLTILGLLRQPSGHILRLQNKMPAAKAMSFYFKSSKANGFRGAPRQTIVTMLSKYIKRTLVTTPESEIKSIKSKEELQKACQLA